MWRVELFHPLIVHFPIALLVVGSCLWLLGRAWRSPARTELFLLPAGRLLLITGTLLAWLAVYTGTLADARVARFLCDPTVLKSHENLAYTISTVFSVAVGVDLASMLKKWPRQLVWPAALVVGALLTAGVLGISYVGHLGARTVYQQAAGVYQPTAACTEFE